MNLQWLLVKLRQIANETCHIHMNTIKYYQRQSTRKYEDHKNNNNYKNDNYNAWRKLTIK